MNYNTIINRCKQSTVLYITICTLAHICLHLHLPIMGFEMKIDLGAALGESEFVKKSQTWPSSKVGVHNEN